MKESMYKYMKIGIIHSMAYPKVMKDEKLIESTIKKIAVDDYFSAVEIANINDLQVRDSVKNILKTSKMLVGFSGHSLLLSQGLNINDINESGRKRAVEVLKEGLDQACEFDAIGFAFLSGNYEEKTKEESYKALIKSTEELCEYAKLKGDIKVLHEVFDYNVDKKSLIGPVQLAKRYAEEMTARYDNFGLMVDLSHLPLLRETAEESLLPVKEYILHAHMGNAVVNPNCEGYGDQHPRFGFPNGSNDVGELIEFLRVLLKIGFLNIENPPIVSFEVKPWKNEDSDVVIANAKRTLNEAWIRL